RSTRARASPTPRTSASCSSARASSAQASRAHDLRAREWTSIEYTRAVGRAGPRALPRRAARTTDSRADSGRLRDSTGRLVVSRWSRLIAAALPLLAVFALVVLVMPVTRPEAAAPEGQLTYAFHVTLAPRWLDPGETESAITPFKVLYAIHDALVKPMPGGQTTPCLAESWSVTPDGTSYTFVLRQNIKFHNGEPVTAEDVKFSFERYKG